VTTGKLLNTLFGWPYFVMMVVGAVLVFAYTLLGGFLAESVSDFVVTVHTLTRRAEGGMAKVSSGSFNDSHNQARTLFEAALPMSCPLGT
jgi:Na+(H+)/acetate symporter ActP